jgi:cobalt-zinc-cadmium resistance protein CzcA
VKASKVTSSTESTSACGLVPISPLGVFAFAAAGDVADRAADLAIVIVGGLILGMTINLFLLPTLYVSIAGSHDVLPAAEAECEESE